MSKWGNRRMMSHPEKKVIREQIQGEILEYKNSRLTRVEQI